MTFRRARPEEYDRVYIMGFEAWGEDQTLASYLEGCRSSPKYQQGVWYLLLDEAETPCSSLITYSLSANTVGIGSIATPPAHRRQGHASALIEQVLAKFASEGQKDFILFSDIDPRFYERLGFIPLPERHQHHKGSVCMIRGKTVAEVEQDICFTPPLYF